MDHWTVDHWEITINISFLVCRFLAPPVQEGSLEKVTCSFRDILLLPTITTHFNDQKGFGETPIASVFTGKFIYFSEKKRVYSSSCHPISLWVEKPSGSFFWCTTWSWCTTWVFPKKGSIPKWMVYRTYNGKTLLKWFNFGGKTYRYFIAETSIYTLVSPSAFCEANWSGQTFFCVNFPGGSRKLWGVHCGGKTPPKFSSHCNELVELRAITSGSHTSSLKMSSNEDKLHAFFWPRKKSWRLQGDNHNALKKTLSTYIDHLGEIDSFGCFLSWPNHPKNQSSIFLERNRTWNNLWRSKVWVGPVPSIAVYNTGTYITSWWFQPIWKIWAKMGIFPK